jgi:hypothetical protein
MSSLFPLAPRYRLDDEMPWLEGIDPTRHYWIRVNGEESRMLLIPGLVAASFEEFKATVKQFRALQPGDQMTLTHPASHCLIVCISQNCYAVEVANDEAPVWHLFDQETLDSLLMTGHPDWQCSDRDLMLGRKLLARSWQQPAVA